MLEHWNIWVGRQPCEGFELRAGEIEVRADDVQQIISDLHLHVIAYILIFLNTTEQFVKVIVISGVKQIPHHAKHTMSTLCKEIDFIAQF